MSAMGYLVASVPVRMASAGTIVALPILAVEKMDNVAVGGLLVAAALGPSVLAAPLVGAVLDSSRHPARWIAASALVTAAAFAMAAFLGSIPLPAVFAVLVLAGAVSPFYMGGLSSFVAGAVPDIRRAYAYDALSYNIAAVGGPAIVALIALFLPAQLALAFLATAAALGPLTLRGVRLLRHTPCEGASLWQAISAGLKRIFSHRPLAVVTISSTFTQLGQGGLATTAVAISIERVGSASDGALIVTAFASGSLLGALMEAARPARGRPQMVMMAGFLATGLLTVAAAVDLGTVWPVVAIGLSGLFTASTYSAMLFLRNLHSPAHLKSQIFTVSAGFRASAAALGAALAGTAAGWGGTVTVTALGIIWVMSAALMSTYPSTKI